MSYDDGVPEKCLPLRLFQIGTKFRDEDSPKHGLLRTREFIMKDMYTFDLDKTSAFETYAEMNDIYTKLFNFIGVPFVKGMEGGVSSGHFCGFFTFSRKFAILEGYWRFFITNFLNCPLTFCHCHGEMVEIALFVENWWKFVIIMEIWWKSSFSWKNGGNSSLP